MKMKLYWYVFKISIFNIIMKIEMKSFFFVCDGHNVCSYKWMLPVRQNILPISAFSFDCSIKIWHARM